MPLKFFATLISLAKTVFFSLWILYLFILYISPLPYNIYLIDELLRNLALKHYSAEPVLTLIYFSFGDNYYKKTNGVAMGTKMGPSYANHFVGFIVHQFFSQINGPKPGLYGRLINDCIGAIFSGYQRGANSNYNSCQSPSPKIYLGNFRHLFDFSRYQSFNWRQRPILQTYGLYRLTSSLVVFIFTSIIHQEFCSFSRFLRLRCLCSDGSDFSDNSEAMYQFFDKRGYPVSVVKVGHQRAQQIDRQSALQTAQKEDADRTRFTLTATRWNLSF